MKIELDPGAMMEGLSGLRHRIPQPEKARDRGSIVLGIDPGPTSSGMVIYERYRKRLELSADSADRATVLDMVPAAHFVVVEDMHCYGQRVGEDVFATAKLIGAIQLRCEDERIPFYTLTRPQVCLHFCGDGRAKQPQVRHVLRERHGGQRVAVGTKKNPGPLYGIRGHAWEALAVALAHLEKQEEGNG